MNRPRVALATCRELPELSPDERRLLPALAAAGLQAEVAAWDDPAVAWHHYTAVLLRTTWNYHRHLARFLDWVGGLEAAGVALWNPPPLLRWNCDKRYLLELAQAGAAVIPTACVPAEAPLELAALMERHGWQEVVVKPAVSATAFHTYRVPRAAAQRTVPRHGVTLVQPYLPEIEREGEWSLVFFDGDYSHGVVKRPKPGDFRVQDEHGGSITPAAAPAWLRAQAEAIVALIRQPWLYARVDGVVVAGRFLLMELELIEPALYFAADPAAAARAAAALARRCRAPATR